MTSLSRRIFDTLTEHPHLSMRELERALGVKERGLQSTGDQPGPFRIAVREIYRETGWIVFSRSGVGGGVTMTRDVALAREAIDRLYAHSFHQKALADDLELCIRETEAQQSAREPFELKP